MTTCLNFGKRHSVSFFLSFTLCKHHDMVQLLKAFVLSILYSWNGHKNTTMVGKHPKFGRAIVRRFRNYFCSWPCSIRMNTSLLKSATSLLNILSYFSLLYVILNSIKCSKHRIKKRRYVTFEPSNLNETMDVGDSWRLRYFSTFHRPVISILCGNFLNPVPYRYHISCTCIHSLITTQNVNPNHSFAFTSSFSLNEGFIVCHETTVQYAKNPHNSNNNLYCR